MSGNHSPICIFIYIHYPFFAIRGCVQPDICQTFVVGTSTVRYSPWRSFRLSWTSNCLKATYITQNVAQRTCDVDRLLNQVWIKFHEWKLLAGNSDLIYSPAMLQATWLLNMNHMVDTEWKYIDTTGHVTLIENMDVLQDQTSIINIDTKLIQTPRLITVSSIDFWTKWNRPFLRYSLISASAGVFEPVPFPPMWYVWFFSFKGTPGWWKKCYI